MHGGLDECLWNQHGHKFGSLLTNLQLRSDGHLLRAEGPAANNANGRGDSPRTARTVRNQAVQASACASPCRRSMASVAASQLGEVLANKPVCVKLQARIRVGRAFGRHGQKLPGRARGIASEAWVGKARVTQKQQKP